MPPHAIPSPAAGRSGNEARAPSRSRDGTGGDRRQVPRGDPGTARLHDPRELTDSLKDDIHARDQRQLELFVELTASGALVLWLALTVFVYSHSFGRSPVLGLLFAPLLAALGAVIGALPLAIACGAGVLVLYPRHPKAGALERYEAAHPRTRPCDVCILVRKDAGPRAGVAYCARCDAWLCPECRGRYDLRAIAALRATRARGGPPAPPEGPLPPSAPAD